MHACIHRTELTSYVCSVHAHACANGNSCRVPDNTDELNSQKLLKGEIIKETQARGKKNRPLFVCVFCWPDVKIPSGLTCVVSLWSVRPSFTNLRLNIFVLGRKSCWKLNWETNDLPVNSRACAACVVKSTSTYLLRFPRLYFRHEQQILCQVRFHCRWLLMCGTLNSAVLVLVKNVCVKTN